MLTFFTDPYPDELLYSAIARYHFYIGNIDYKDTLEELFNKRSIIPNFHLGSYLNALAEQLSESYTAEKLIFKHTSFPFYAPFLSRSRKEELITEMKYEAGGQLYTKLGFVAGSICKHEGIYYCRECSREDYIQYGEAYIHRAHQLQGVFVCHIHGVPLELYECSTRNTSRLEFIRLDINKLEKQAHQSLATEMCPMLLKIARMAYKLLQQPINSLCKEAMERKYKQLLGEKGLLTTSGRVKQRELHEAFITFYGRKLLAFLESDLEEVDEYNWLKVVTRNMERTVHPLRHILLMNFLTEDLLGFLEKEEQSYAPFGIGPWPCLNKVAKHYGEAVIDIITITADYKTRLPVGTFTCSCGFVYSRKGPDKQFSDRFMIGRIKAFGTDWDNCLKERLKAKETSLRSVARQMYCDPKTIRKRARLLGINILEENQIVQELLVEENTIEVSADKLEIYKKQVLNKIDTYNNLSRTALRKLIGKEYIYIYRKDKEWLFENLPMKIKAKADRNTVDWDKRDKDLLKKVKTQYQELLIREKPVRITKSLIGKELGCLALLEKNKTHLPYTMQYLEEIVEEVSIFQLRRCKKIIDEAQRNSQKLSLWQLQKRGGLRKETFEHIRSKLESDV